MTAGGEQRVSQVGWHRTVRRPAADADIGTSNLLWRGMVDREGIAIEAAYGGEHARSATVAAGDQASVFPLADVTEAIPAVAAHPGESRPQARGGPVGERLRRDLQAGDEFSCAQPCTWIAEEASWPA